MLFADDSFIIPFQDLQDATYGQVTSGVPGTYFRNIDQILPVQQANMLKVTLRLLLYAANRTQMKPQSNILSTVHQQQFQDY